MKLVELNCRIAMKLYPGRALYRNGEVVSCCGKTIDYRKPNMIERLLHELGDVKIHVVKGYAEVNGSVGQTLSEAVALAYVNKQ